ncbi:MAG TPA: arginine deiminase family protein [Gemmatimonadaceae bacterium]|jgi:dimethylargininase|nr:arginine deiminase family protein [Gemmatimonadaceae bacterium]
MITAITRSPAASMERCELTFLQRETIDIERARAQHAAYRAALVTAGADVILLPALDDLPDSVFVEDTAIVLDSVAIMSMMGAESRRRETAAMAPVLRRYRTVQALGKPATLDGGDVMRVGTALYVGQTARTNRAAVEQLSKILGPAGYRVIGVPLTECLHLKSACTEIGPHAVLINPDWVPPALFDGLRVITIDPDEPFGANAVIVGRALVVPASAPRTRERLVCAGFQPIAVDISEFEKAEAAATCLSIILS